MITKFLIILQYLLMLVYMMLNMLKLVLNCRSDERGIHVNDLAKELRLPLEKIMSVLLFFLNIYLSLYRYAKHLLMT
jgi:hypothetical protein